MSYGGSGLAKVCGVTALLGSKFDCVVVDVTITTLDPVSSISSKAQVAVRFDIRFTIWSRSMNCKRGNWYEKAWYEGLV